MDPERAAQLLAQERARIENTLQAMDELGPGDLAAKGLDDHLIEKVDQADDLNQREIDAALKDRLSHELSQIVAAEARLREGTFGLSVESGEPIPEDRLEAIPWAERTLEEQERFEGA